MTAFTTAEIDAQLTLWKSALAACSGNQSYALGGRSLTRADLPEIRNTIDWLEQKRMRTSNGGARVRYGTTEA